MAYQGLDNQTDFEAELSLLADENARDILLVLVKVTYDIADDGGLSLADEQESICFEGEYFGEPGQSSKKVAPEANFDKLATDIVLIGHAYAPNGQAVTQFDIGIQVANMRQHIRVFGDRVWQKRTTGNKIVTWHMSAPDMVTKIPVIYEKAFGGQDLTPENKKHFVFEPRNLLGTGIIAKDSHLEEVALPNFEDPKQLIQSPADRPAPLGMGFISPDWQPRLGFAGTYDGSWEKTRLPLLPNDFNRAFFNAAHPNLVAQGFLTGNEDIHLINVCPQGKLSLKMPGEIPQVGMQFQYEAIKALTVKLDSVIINTDDMKLILLWRATQDVTNRIYDMKTITVKTTVKTADEIEEKIEWA